MLSLPQLPVPLPRLLALLVLALVLGGCSSQPAVTADAGESLASGERAKLAESGGNGASGEGSEGSETNQSNESEPGICARQWILDSLAVDGREHKPRMFWQKMWRDRPYLTCDKLGFVRGSAGSNPFLGKFELADSGSVRWLKPPKISRMVGRRDSGELEQDFLLALPRVTRASARGDTLILEGSDGTRLEFKSAGEQPGS